MVFSVDTIKKSKNISLNNRGNIEESINYEDTNWFQLSLEMVLEESVEFNNMICMNEGIGELILGAAGDALKRSLKALNPYDILSKVFDWFINSLATLGRHFEAFLLNFLNDDIELAAFKKRLEHYRGAIRYDKPYFEYRNLDISTSYTTYEAEIEREYDNLVRDLSKLRDLRSNMEIAEYINNMSMMNQYEESDMEVMRGRVLGLNKPVSKDNYADELFLFFRTTATPIEPKLGFFDKANMDGERVHEAYKSYYKAGEQKMRIRRDIIKMKTEATKEKAKCRTVKPSDFLTENQSMDSSVVRIYNNIVSNKCKKIQAICDIYVTMFGAKIDALKEYNKTNKRILLLACQQMVKEG